MRIFGLCVCVLTVLCGCYFLFTNPYKCIDMYTNILSIPCSTACVSSSVEDGSEPSARESTRSFSMLTALKHIDNSLIETFLAKTSCVRSLSSSEWHWVSGGGVARRDVRCPKAPVQATVCAIVRDRLNRTQNRKSYGMNRMRTFIRYPHTHTVREDPRYDRQTPAGESISAGTAVSTRFAPCRNCIIFVKIP
jgi:hypothetical protein